MQFGQVLHYFNSYDPTGLISDTVLGSPSITIMTNLIERTNYFGIGIAINPATWIPCDENIHLFYNIKNNYGCDSIILKLNKALYNLNRFNDIVINNIPAARTGRYTMELWIYVDGNNLFNYGINIIYSQHMSISILSDISNPTNLIAYCLPQAYKDVIIGLNGTKFLNVYNSAINKVSETYINGMSSWIYVRCAFDQNREIFYINQQIDKIVIPELTQSQQNTITPYKFFGDKTVTVTLQNFQLNFTRIFMKSLNIYREYIPREFDFRWK